jgi:tetratricopeptide (TPR) repeat protein
MNRWIRRFLAFSAIACAAMFSFRFLPDISAQAQIPPTRPTPPQAARPVDPAAKPQVTPPQVTPLEVAPPESGARAALRLDQLFEKLKQAENANAAKVIANDIERILERSGSATADLIYSRAKEAMVAKDFDLALDLFDYTISLKPSWAEPYHRRAVIHFVLKDQDAAFRDIREVLVREPRHFHALAGLGGILRQLGNAKGAYRAFTRALEIHPHFDDLKESVEKMRPEIEGQPI